MVDEGFAATCVGTPFYMSPELYRGAQHGHRPTSSLPLPLPLLLPLTLPLTLPLALALALALPLPLPP